MKQIELWFQFRNGSIKSDKEISKKLDISCFNSEMVRLKDPNSLSKIVCFNCFNSEMVRLKGSYPGASSGADRSFNSEMVRLKEEAKPCAERLLFVSIPKWFD